MTNTAVITLAHGRHAHLARQHLALHRSVPRPDLYVVVAMDDPEVARWRPHLDPVPTVLTAPRHPGGLPLAAARNLGARSALSAGADLLVFLDVDCLPAEDLVAGYREAVLGDPGRVWSGPVTYLPPAPPGGFDPACLADMDAPHPDRPAPPRGVRVPQDEPDLFWALSFAVHRDTWHRIGGFCEDYVGYGGEDTDFARSAVAAGVGLGWVGDARAYHQHHTTESPPVRHLDDILRNGRLFRNRWGTWPMTGWLHGFRELGLVVESGNDWVRTESAPGRSGA